MNPLDPSLTMDAPPFSISKIGFDCTMPLSQDRIARVSQPIPQPARVKPLTEDQIVEEMTGLIEQAPKSWREILAHFAGQPYPLVYRAFGQLRPKLGRMADQGPEYPYTFADTNFVYGKPKS